jgi:hypothetical protein
MLVLAAVFVVVSVLVALVGLVLILMRIIAVVIGLFVAGRLAWATLRFGRLQLFGSRLLVRLGLVRLVGLLHRLRLLGIPCIGRVIIVDETLILRPLVVERDKDVRNGSRWRTKVRASEGATDRGGQEQGARGERARPRVLNGDRSMGSPPVAR